LWAFLVFGDGVEKVGDLSVWTSKDVELGFGI
jgi:hypothetical protein